MVGKQQVWCGIMIVPDTQKAESGQQPRHIPGYGSLPKTVTIWKEGGREEIGRWLMEDSGGAEQEQEIMQRWDDQHR